MGLVLRKGIYQKKLIISYLILVILPILVLGMYSYYVSKKSDKTDEAYNGKQCRCNFLQFAK